MSDTSITPNIEVTIGRQTRLYHAFVTTAPAALDAPSTLTLYAGPLKDVAGFAVDSVALDATKAATPSRLVLIDTAELGWQRARCRSRAHRLTPADPVLVGLNTLQQWLWQRLQIPIAASARMNANNLGNTTSRERAGVPTMTTITIQILKTNGHSAPGKLADAEIHFTGGELDGLKLVGFAVWQRRDGVGQNVSFPSRQFTVHGERRSFSLLRWISDPGAQDKVGDLVLQEFRAANQQVV